MKPFPLAVAALLLSFSMSPCVAQGRLLVDQKGDRSLAIVDPVAGAVIASVPESGITGHEVAASPDGRLAIVPIYGNSGVGKPGTDGGNIDVIDLAARKIVGNIAFDHGVRPHCAVFGPRDGLLYVSTELDKTITIIDPKTLKVVGAIPTNQPESHMFVISRSGLRAYTANVGPGTVSVLDLKARKTLAVIPVSASTQRIAISPNDKWVLTADQASPQIAVIDTASNRVSSRVPIEGLGYGSAVTPDSRYALIAVPAANKMDVIELATMKMVRGVAVCQSPQEVLIRPDGKTAYVSCIGSDQVAEVDLATWKVTRTIATGKGPDGLGWASR